MGELNNPLDLNEGDKPAVSLCSRTIVPGNISYLEEPPQPPDLEDALANNDANDEQVPPFHPAVGALRRVAVSTLAHDDVALLVLNPLQQLRQLPHLDLERVLRCVRLRHVHDAVHVERYLLGGCAPVLIPEAVNVLSIVFRIEGEIAVRDRLVVDFILAVRVRDLGGGGTNVSIGMHAKLVIIQSERGLAHHTQKSMSRFPALPNSRSPTWNVTVILSPWCRFSWKHSRPCAGS